MVAVSHPSTIPRLLGWPLQREDPSSVCDERGAYSKLEAEIGKKLNHAEQAGASTAHLAPDLLPYVACTVRL